mgnify:CR=1 FL=1
MRRTAVYRHPLFLEHDTGKGHLESPSRLHALYQELDGDDLAARLLFPLFPPASLAAVQLNHSSELVRTVAATSTRMASFLDADTRTSAASYAAALLAAGAVIDGIERLVQGEIDNGFCLVRPPGHHAEFHRAMGFCLFNNVAVGAQWALHHLGLQRILIVDWDVHHGNGTQKSFYQTDQVLYCSLHQYPFYPGTGALLESGEGPGQGYTVNVPLCSGHGDMEYARVFNQLIVPITRAYQPQLVLVSCGFDCMAGDPIGAMRVTPAGIAYMTRVLRELAEEMCQGRLLCTLEGGYDHNNMWTGVLAMLSELGGTPVASNFSGWLDSQLELRLRRSTARSADINQAIQKSGTR